MPRGIYDRSKSKATPVVAALTTVVAEEAQKAAEVANKQAAIAIMQKVEALGKEIGHLYQRVENTVMDVGRKLYDVKVVLDGVDANLRRSQNVPTFTKWMNETAPDLCNMTKRSVWHYYQQFAEAQVAGLSEKTIIALAPTLLKNQKTREAVTATLTHNPELAMRLNDAARSPARLRAIAKSDEVKEIISHVKNGGPEPTPSENRKDRIKRAILAALRPVFKSREGFNIKDANKALADLVYGVREAEAELRISQFVPVFYVPLKPENVDALFGEAPAGVAPPSSELMSAVQVGIEKSLTATATAA